MPDYFIQRRSHVDLTSRKVIDVASGILVGLRGCSPEEAFTELAQVAKQTRAGIGSIATGLVLLASGSSPADHAEAFNVWGELVGPRELSARV
ncbi:MAG: ANTAR domain-containing protein [Mycobacterium sp.]